MPFLLILYIIDFVTDKNSVRKRCGNSNQTTSLKQNEHNFIVHATIIHRRHFHLNSGLCIGHSASLEIQCLKKHRQFMAADPQPWVVSSGTLVFLKISPEKKFMGVRSRNQRVHSTVRLHFIMLLLNMSSKNYVTASRQ